MAYMAPLLPPGMQHVERRELYTSFAARLKYLHSFIEFGQEDIDALASARPFIKSLIPTVSELVYDKLLENDITAQALVTQSTKKDSDLDAEDYFDGKSTNVKMRHLFVRWYLTKVNGDPTVPEYWEYMNKVGAMHNGHIRRQPLQIDVIHFSLMIGHIQNVLNEAIITSPGISPMQKATLVKAWGKLLWIQNDLFAKWHVKDGEEYGDQMSYPGMKLTDADMKDEDGNTMFCPFSSISHVSRTTSRRSGQEKEGYVYRGPGIGSIQSIVDPTLISPAASINGSIHSNVD